MASSGQFKRNHFLWPKSISQFPSNIPLSAVFFSSVFISRSIKNCAVNILFPKISFAISLFKDLVCYSALRNFNVCKPNLKHVKFMYWQTIPIVVKWYFIRMFESGFVKSTILKSKCESSSERLAEQNFWNTLSK